MEQGKMVSLAGVAGSQKVTELYKGKLKIFLIFRAQWYKFAWLLGRHAKQGRKSVIVIRWYCVEKSSLNG